MSSEERGHAAHLHLSGELDIDTAPILERSLRGAESNGYTGIVLDLERLTFMDSSGLHSFLRAAERAGGSGRTFSVVKASATVRKVIELTQSSHLLSAESS